MADQVYKVRDPQGNIREIRGPAGASDEQVLAKAKELFAGPKDYRALAKYEPVDPTADMSHLDRFNAGVGKAMTDVGHGAQQLLGGGPSAEETRDRRALDRPLMNTAGGVAGNVAGNVTMLAPLSVIPGGATVAGAATLGATAGALQPGESAKERIIAMLTGAALGGGVQAAAGPGARAVGEWGANRAAANAAEQSQNAVRDATLRTGQEAGFTLPASVANPSTANKILDSVAGKAAVGQEASIRNQRVVDALARQESNLPPTQALSEQALRGARRAVAGPYRELTAISPQAAADMEALKAARLESKLNWQFHGRSGDPAAHRAATAADAQAAQLEQSLLAHAQSAGRADLIPALIEARQQIAKIHDVERALNVGTGSVDASVLGRARDRGAPLSDGLRTIADFQQAFPSAMREASTVPTPGVSKIAAVLSGAAGAGGFAAGGPAGVALAAAPFVVPPAARSFSMRLGQTGGRGYGGTASERIAAALADQQMRERLGLAGRAMALPMIPEAVNP